MHPYEYTTQLYHASIPVSEYLEHYVDVKTFLNACKACPNFDKVWSCPSYDFDVLSYWRQYQTLLLTARKITFCEEALSLTFPPEEVNEIINQVVLPEKQKLTDMLMEEEKKYPGSISLSAGSCNLCKNGCAKPLGQPGRFPDQMRYSSESLGGNVGLTIEKLMGIQLEWMEEGKLPHHFVLVCGLLIP